jgi:4-amino-4-deoxy-L-arabinose transferase-like glycosyltransferase
MLENGNDEHLNKLKDVSIYDMKNFISKANKFLTREYKLLILILFIALTLRIIYTFQDPIRWWDETVYSSLGYDLSHNPLDYSFKNNWSDFVPSGGDSFYAWPKAGFRPPLLPYSLSIFYFFRIDFLINLLMPFIGTLTVFFVYLFGKKLFNSKAGLYSALFLALLPIHAFYSEKILNDVFSTFFMLVSFFVFWKGFEENNSKYKILFGFFMALSLLARYTCLWIMPVFLIYLIVRNKSLKFLKDKYLWYTIAAFFITLIPWLIYGLSEYGNPIGQFIHGLKSAAYWGGLQPWSFFFDNSWKMFSIIGFVFVFSILYIFIKKDYLKKEIYLILIWISFFLAMLIIMPHKEDRFIMPIVTAICLLSGYFIDKLKRYKSVLLILLVLVLLYSNYSQFADAYHSSKSREGTYVCLFEAMGYIKGLEKEVLIINDESPTIYDYTKKPTAFYPNPVSLDALRGYKLHGRETYALFTDYDMPLYDEEHVKIKKILDDNFEKTFECDKGGGISAVYKVS